MLETPKAEYHTTTRTLHIKDSRFSEPIQCVHLPWIKKAELFPKVVENVPALRTWIQYATCPVRLTGGVQETCSMDGKDQDSNFQNNNNPQEIQPWCGNMLSSSRHQPEVQTPLQTAPARSPVRKDEHPHPPLQQGSHQLDSTPKPCCTP